MANLVDPKPRTKDDDEDEKEEEEEYDDENETLNRNKPWATLSCPPERALRAVMIGAKHLQAPDAERKVAA
jgi:hypothetical protein